MGQKHSTTKANPTSPAHTKPKNNTPQSTSRHQKNTSANDDIVFASAIFSNCSPDNHHGYHGGCDSEGGGGCDSGGGGGCDSGGGGGCDSGGGGGCDSGGGGGCD